MEVPDYVSRYRQELAALVRQVGREQAMDLIVGGQYTQIGILERSALISAGLRASDTVVDVGCGSGRLTYALRSYLRGKYIGTDILGDALDYARERAGRPDWKYVETVAPEIPADDASADMVCFFSVFTHLLDEDIYRFLVEARRVLRPTGLVRLIDGDEPWVALTENFDYTDGRKASGTVAFGQSVAILQHP